MVSLQRGWGGGLKANKNEIRIQFFFVFNKGNFEK